MTSDQTPLTAEDIALLRRAHTIGAISYNGDPWYAKDEGYDYDDAEKTMAEAGRLLAALDAARSREKAYGSVRVPEACAGCPDCDDPAADAARSRETAPREAARKVIDVAYLWTDESESKPLFDDIPVELLDPLEALRAALAQPEEKA